MTADTEPAPVVLVHGIRLSGSVWAPVVALLRDRLTIEAPDLPGHGTRGGAPFTIDTGVRAVVDAIERLGRPAVVVGHSLGGYVALATASRYPELVAGVVGIGCTARPRGLGKAVYQYGAALVARYPDRFNRFSERRFRRALPVETAEALLAGQSDLAVMPSAVAAIIGGDPIADLRKYPGPVWLVNGGADHFRVDENAFLRACQDGRLLHLPGHSHLSCQGESVMLARIIMDAADRCRTVAQAAD